LTTISTSHQDIETSDRKDDHNHPEIACTHQMRTMIEDIDPIMEEDDETNRDGMIHGEGMITTIDETDTVIEEEEEAIEEEEAEDITRTGKIVTTSTDGANTTGPIQETDMMTGTVEIASTKIPEVVEVDTTMTDGRAVEVVVRGIVTGRNKPARCLCSTPSRIFRKRASHL